MFLRTLNIARPVRLFKNYAAWLIFCDAVLILTNAFASLDKIAAYGFHAVDIVLTFGFLVFTGILEATAAAVGLVLVELLLEKAMHKKLDLPFRLLMAVILVVSWGITLLTIFHLV